MGFYVMEKVFWKKLFENSPSESQVTDA